MEKFEKTAELILNEVKNFNESATKEDRISLAIYLVLNMVNEATDNYFESIGVVDLIHAEMRNKLIANAERQELGFDKLISISKQN